MIRSGADPRGLRIGPAVLRPEREPAKAEHEERLLIARIRHTDFSNGAQNKCLKRTFSLQLFSAAAILSESILVCFSFKSGHSARPPTCRLCATSGCEQLQHRSPLFDHLVGAQQEGFRQLEAERLGDSEIDDQLELRRLLDRKLACLRAAQNLSTYSPARRNKSGMFGP